jgi:hypothetical protein
MNDQELNQNQSSYWPSVMVASLVVGVVVFIISIVAGYMRINSEPSTSMIPGLSISSLLPCLMGAFAGMVAVWHYTKEVDTKMKLGRGALIGFFTGVAVTFIQIVLNKAWILVDPDFLTALQEHMIRGFEMSSLPEQQKQMMIDSAYEQMQSQQTLWGTITNFFWGGLISGVLNVLTGMIGVKVFAEKPETTL